MKDTQKTRLHATAKAAGLWWADRLTPDYRHKHAEFAAAVASLVERELSGECYWDWRGELHQGDGRRGCDGDKRITVEFDYDPHGLLVPAFAQVFGEQDMSRKAWQEALPIKHDLRIHVDRLVPKEGYGNWTAVIPV